MRTILKARCDGVEMSDLSTMQMCVCSDRLYSIHLNINIFLNKVFRSFSLVLPLFVSSLTFTRTLLFLYSVSQLWNAQKTLHQIPNIPASSHWSSFKVIERRRCKRLICFSLFLSPFFFYSIYFFLCICITILTRIKHIHATINWTLSTTITSSVRRSSNFWKRKKYETKKWKKT